MLWPRASANTRIKLTGTFFFHVELSGLSLSLSFNDRKAVKEALQVCTVTSL